MQLIKILIFLLLSFSFADCFGQDSQQEREKLNVLIKTKIFPKGLPDSTALYTGLIQITVDPKRAYVPVLVSTNADLSDKMQGVEALLKFNYKPLVLQQKTTHFIIPIAITTIAEKDRQHAKIDVQLIGKRISEIFYKPPVNTRDYEVEYLQPILLTITNVLYH